MERHKKAIQDLAFLVLLGLFLGCLHHAVRGEIPLFVKPQNPRFEALRQLDARQLKNSLKQAGTVLLDARPSRAFQRERISGSLSVPLHSNFEDELSAELKQATLVVTYCDGPKCDASKQLALRLQEELGLGNVAVFDGGLEDWSAQGWPVERD